MSDRNQSSKHNKNEAKDNETNRKFVRPAYQLGEHKHGEDKGRKITRPDYNIKRKPEKF